MSLGTGAAAGREAGARVPSGPIVAEGRGVLTPFVAANHDPLCFPDPEAFGPGLRPGVHGQPPSDLRDLTGTTAPGHQPARVERQVAVETLARRLPPDPELALLEDELTWSNGSRVCGLTELLVRW